ncbi:hypothetical protein AB4Z52_17370 [Rhizobium sp. 2YAF20]|uniref:hypothetical protein n=1 Tax=Rhizobium sp. 2YAF20 TaxID=3233027 RepID=UPI003F9A8AA8
MVDIFGIARVVQSVTCLKYQLMAKRRYSVRSDKSGTWSVIDAVTDDVADVRGVLLVGLGLELAEDTAQMLNLEEAIRNARWTKGDR